MRGQLLHGPLDLRTLPIERPFEFVIGEHVSDRMPPGRPLAGASGWSRSDDQPSWSGPAVIFQTVLVVYFVFLLWMEYDAWQREEAALALHAANDDHDEF